MRVHGNHATKVITSGLYANARKDIDGEAIGCASLTVEIASCAVVINCAGQIIVEFFLWRYRPWFGVRAVAV